jgi:hypothetical protein
MKMRIVLALAGAVALLQPLNSKADDLFQLFWRGTYYTKNASGHIVAVPFTEQTFVNQVARNNGLDPSQCVFVYRPNKRDTVVVRRNGAFVADVIQMEYTYTDVTNPSGTATVRQAFLYDEAHDSALGSFMGTEKRSYNTQGGLADDQLSGRFQYSKPDIDTVYSGSAWTGQRVVDRSGAP